MSTTPEPVEPTTAATETSGPDAAAEQDRPAAEQEQPAAEQEQPAEEQPAEAQPAELHPDAPLAAPGMHAPQSLSTEEAPEQPDPAEAGADGPAPSADEAPADAPDDAGAGGGSAGAQGGMPEATAVPADAAAQEEPPAASAEDAAAAEEAPAGEAGAPPATSIPDAAPAASDAEASEAPPTAPAPSEAPAEAPPTDADQPEAEQPEAEQRGDAEQPTEAEGGKRRKKKKGKGGDAPAAQPEQRKRKGPEPAEVMARIGTTNDQALAYLADPDPKLSRLSRKVTEALLPDLHPVTAAALMGPAGFTRHLVASAASGRYRDLFVLWETFRRFPQEAKPELAERSAALAKAQEKLGTAVRIGLTGRSMRLAEDIAEAEGLIWQWLREALVAHLPAVGARPAVASALLKREPDLDVPLPAHPDERWLAEAATARQGGPLADRVEATLGANVHRLPATVDTLRLATVHYPDRVAALVDRVDLDAPDIGAFLAWARDHGAADRLHGRIRERVAGTAARDRAEGLSRWYAWQQRGVSLELPEALRTDSLEDFDLSKPETAELAARLVARGVSLDLQAELEAMAAENRQRAEKAYEAMVCADLPVTLPAALKDNPVVNPGTRCPKCQAWTWVRPGHEDRCPRPEAPEAQAEPDPFELAAAEVSSQAPAPTQPEE